jgi:hypothetical protein
MLGTVHPGSDFERPEQKLLSFLKVRTTRLDGGQCAHITCRIDIVGAKARLGAPEILACERPALPTALREEESDGVLVFSASGLCGQTLVPVCGSPSEGLAFQIAALKRSVCASKFIDRVTEFSPKAPR